MLRVAVAALLMSGLISLPAQQVRDSAGIRIVESTAAMRAGAQAWRVEATPFVDIYAESGTKEMAMTMEVARLADGRIAVASQATNNVRFFDSTGNYLSSFGRKGNGPGEFPQLLRFYVLRGDTLLTVSSSNLALFTSQGRYLRDLPRGEPRAPRPAAFTGDGTAIGADMFQMMNERGTTRTGTWTDTVPLVRIPVDRRKLDTIGRLAVQQRHAVPGPERARNLVYGPWYSITSSPDLFYAGFQGTYEFKVYDQTGRLVRIQRRSPVSKVFSDSAINAYKTAMSKVTQLSDGGEKIQLSPQQVAQMNANMQFPRTYPEFISMEVDRSANLWVERYNDGRKVHCGGFPCTITYAKAGTWDVFDPSGRWLTTVAIPPDFTPLDFGSNYLGGVWRDADDVEHVRYYRIIKP